MKYLNSLFEIGVQDWLDFLIKFVAILFISAIILWLFYFIIVKLYGKKTKLHRDFFLPIQFLWSLFALFLVFSVYWFYFIKTNGIHAFNWSSPAFYADISPQILIYLMVIIVFIISYSKYNALLKK